MGEPRRTPTRDRGAVLPFVAILLPVLLIMTAFAIDLGMQRSSRRTMQARADIIALDMVRLADGRTLGAIMAANATPNAEAYLASSAARNEVARDKISYQWGTFKVGRNPEFQAVVGQNDIPDAVKVTATEPVDYFFAGAIPGVDGGSSTTRTAIAAYGEPVGSFSIGSFAANLDSTNSGVLNSILTPLLGNPAGISALSYTGLASADLGVADLAAELGLLNPEAALSTNVGTTQFLVAAANVLERQGNAVQANILRSMLTPQVDALGPISLGDLVYAETGAEAAALATRLNALDLVTAAAFGSRCTDPDDLATCSAVSLPSLTTTLPLTSLTGSARIIQGKVTVTGPVGAEGGTNQTEVRLGFNLGAQNVGTCKPSLANLLCLLDGLLVGAVDATVEADLVVKLADAFGRIDALDCGTPKGIDVATDTGLYSVTGTIKINFGRRGLLGGVLGPLLGSLNLTVNNQIQDIYDLIQFDVPPSVLGETVAQTGNGDIGLSGLNATASGGTGVLGTLGNLGITNTLVPLLNTLVNPLLSQLDQTILGPLTDVLGLNVAGSDVTPLKIGCEAEGLKLVG